MQTNTDENTLNSAVLYSSPFDRQIQSHVMTGLPLHGEAMISFADESWNTHPVIRSAPSYLPIATPPPYHHVGNFPEMETAISASSTVANPAFDYSLEGLPLMNPWISTQGFNSCSTQGLPGYSKELSLSLATSHKRHVGGSESTSCSSNSLSLNADSYKSPLPVLSGSRFFQAMQEILGEISCYVLESFDQASYADGRRCSRIGASDDGLDSDHGSVFRNHESKKKHMLSLLQAVDDQYNQCLDEIHTVVSAFHAVTELDPNLHARFALPTISLMYRSLRERISSYILAMGPNPSEREEKEDNSFETSFIKKQWALQQLRKGDHQLWRPQRGLPERSVSVLRAWMFQNFLHPYPKDSEKHLLALKSGLTRSQVSNWFINARVRLWKPMIEEMYAEMNRRKAHRNDEEGIRGTLKNLMNFESTRFSMH